MSSVVTKRQNAFWTFCHRLFLLQLCGFQVENPDDFQGKLAMDLGAGSGILSFFAVQVKMARNNKKQWEKSVKKITRFD